MSSSPRSSFPREFVLGTLALALLPVSSRVAASLPSAAPDSTTGKASSSHPNIVFILADDLGIGDVGCFGQDKIQTPNIDRLATRGTRFTQCYAGSPVCGPSRSVLMTGLHAGHTRVRGNSAFAGGLTEGKARRMHLTEADRTVANVLHDVGYRTGLVGKWHLEGYNRQATPLDRGFDEMYGWLLWQKGTHEPYYYPSQIFVNRDLVEVPGNRNGARGIYETDLYEGYAADFIRRNQDKPFFLYFAPSAPHDPLVEPPDLEPYASKDWPKDMKIYAATITRLDRAVGQLVALLEELKLSDNTLIIFTSDNGPRSIPTPQLTRVVEFFDSNGVYRGYKRDLYEGGFREPTVAVWPGHVPAGRVNGAIWYFPDFLPTAAEVAGAPIPEKTDGVSILPVLLGQREQLPERTLYWEFYERGFEQAAQRGHWKAVRHAIDGPIELYDQSGEDKAELINVAAQHPDIVAEMAAAMKQAHVDSPEFPVDHASGKSGE